MQTNTINIQTQEHPSNRKKTQHAEERKLIVKRKKTHTYMEDYMRAYERNIHAYENERIRTQQHQHAE